MIKAQEAFPKRLQGLMESTNTTQQKLSDFIGVKRQSIAQYADGSILPTIEKLAKIADYFGVSADYLLGRTDMPSPDLDDITVHAITGLSAKAIHILKDYYSRQKLNSFALTVNALLEQGSALDAISRYLYYNLDEQNEGKVIPFHIKYKYAEYGAWGESDKLPHDASINLEGIDNDMIKQVLQIGVQEQLNKLREHENKREHATEGGI